MAVGHLVAARQYADPLTKRTGTNPELLSDLVDTGELELRDPKQNWNRIASGRELLHWEHELHATLHSQPERLDILLRKGRRRHGSIWYDEKEGEE